MKSVAKFFFGSIAILLLATNGNYCQGRKVFSFFIAQDGKSSNDGSKAKPFASLDDATIAISKISVPYDAIVYIMKGTYYLSKSFVYSEAVSDSDHSITFTNLDYGKVVFTGSAKLDNELFQIVTDKDVLQRLPSIARGKVFEIDLKRAGVLDYGKWLQHGSNVIYPSHLELFYNHFMLPLARWPNDRLAPIGDVLDHGSSISKGEKDNRGAKFSFTNNRLANWRNVDNVWVYGHFAFGYSDEYIKVDTLDVINKTIRLKSASGYGVFSSDDESSFTLKNSKCIRGFYIYNLLEEIDTPGEWYLDEKANKLYIWFPDAHFSLADIRVSVLEDPLIVLSNTNGVTIRGIEFECSRGIGLLLDKTKNTTIEHCTFHNLGTVAISSGDQLNIKNKWHEYSPSSTGQNPSYNRHLQILRCSIFDTGTGGIILDGGDRKKLIAAKNLIENCEIYNYSVLNQTNCPAIKLGGVGNAVMHCYIHDAPDQAILFQGNDQIISFNHIRRVVTYMTDNGAFYTGRDISSTGSEITYNFFDSVGGVNGAAVCSVYLDDGSGGIGVNSNVFFKANIGDHGFGAVHINGGGNSTFCNNYFINCTKAFSNTQWSDVQWKGFITSPPIVKRYFVDVNIFSDVYKKNYPDLLKLADSTNISPRRNYITNTLTYSVPLFSSGATYVIRNTCSTDNDPVFESLTTKNFDLIRIPKCLKDADKWESIPFDKIGLLRE